MTARVWHKAEQIFWVNLAFSHAWICGYIRMHICTSAFSLSLSLYIYPTHIWLSVSIYRNIYSLYIYIYNIHTPGYTCMSLWIKWFSRHIWIHACASLWTKSGFLDLPFQDGHKLGVCMHWLGPNGVFTSDSVCAHLQCHLLLGSIFLNTFP